MWWTPPLLLKILQKYFIFKNSRIRWYLPLSLFDLVVLYSVRLMWLFWEVSFDTTQTVVDGTWRRLFGCDVLYLADVIAGPHGWRRHEAGLTAREKTFVPIDLPTNRRSLHNQAAHPFPIVCHLLGCLVLYLTTPLPTLRMATFGSLQSFQVGRSEKLITGPLPGRTPPYQHVLPVRAKWKMEIGIRESRFTRFQRAEANNKLRPCCLQVTLGQYTRVFSMDHYSFFGDGGGGGIGRKEKDGKKWSVEEDCVCVSVGTANKVERTMSRRARE